MKTLIIDDSMKDTMIIGCPNHLFAVEISPRCFLRVATLPDAKFRDAQKELLGWEWWNVKSGTTEEDSNCDLS